MKDSRELQLVLLLTEMKLQTTNTPSVATEDSSGQMEAPLKAFGTMVTLAVSVSSERQSPHQMSMKAFGCKIARPTLAFSDKIKVMVSTMISKPSNRHLK